MVRACVNANRENQNPLPVLARRGSQGSRPVFFQSVRPRVADLAAIPRLLLSRTSRWLCLSASAAHTVPVFAPVHPLRRPPSPYTAGDGDINAIIERAPNSTQDPK